MGRPAKKKRGRPKNPETPKKPKAKKAVKKPEPKKAPAQKKKKSVLPDLLSGKFVLINPEGVLLEDGAFGLIGPEDDPKVFLSKDEAKAAIETQCSGDDYFDEIEVKPLSKYMAQSYEIDTTENNKLYVSLVTKDVAIPLKAAVKKARARYEDTIGECRKALKDAQAEFNKAMLGLSEEFEKEQKGLRLDIKTQEKELLKFEKQMARMK